MGILQIGGGSLVFGNLGLTTKNKVFFVVKLVLKVT